MPRYSDTLYSIAYGKDRKMAKKSGSKPPPIKPGQKVPDSGIYKETGGTRRATMVRGELAPPTTEAGKKWRQVVDTNPNN